MGGPTVLRSLQASANPTANMSPPQEGTVSEAQVLTALQEVLDPDLHKDIVTLNFVKDLQIDGSKVAFAVELTTPACPAKADLKAQAESVAGASRASRTCRWR